jgi:PAS domain S-box-containing protein
LFVLLDDLSEEGFMTRKRSQGELEKQAKKLREAEKALRESEEKYRTLVEQADDAILILQEGRTIYRNPKWAKLLGYAIEETAQQSFLDTVVEEDRDRVRQYYKDRLAGLPAPEQYELRLRARSGEVLSMEVRPRVISIGGQPGTMVIMRDVTERRQAEEALRESEARFRSVFQSAKDCIFIKDLDLKYVLVNPCMERMFGIKASELIGRGDEAIFGEDIVRHIRAVDLRVLEGESIEEEHTKPVQGKITVFHVIKVPIRSDLNAIIGLCGIARDITKRKLSEEALRSYHEKLRSLASQLSLAEERERRRISTHVHDHIGQNMAFAKMKLVELKKQIPQPELKGTVHEICRLIDDAIQDTRCLVTELGSPVLYELGFVPAVKALVSNIQQRHGIPLVLKDDGRFKSLSDDVQILLYQAIRELLANMVKHSGASSGAVSIQTDDKQIRIEVEDNGIGFDTNMLGNLSPHSRSYGLFSVRERLEPLGGSVAVESEPGRGTCVVLTVPLEPGVRREE